MKDQFVNNLKRIKLEAETRGTKPELSKEVKLDFFRIAQKALSNSR